MPRKNLSLPSIDNSNVSPKRKEGFRTIGEALTENEERVTNPTGWMLDRMGL